MSRNSLRVCATAPAKTNLALHVGAPTADGYHPLETLFAAVDVRESVTATLAQGQTGDNRITVTVTAAPGSPYAAMVNRGAARLSDIPLDESNLAVRAARAVCEVYREHPRIMLHIHKAVPVAGGMAGGSADAAAALVAVDTLLARHLGTQELGSERLMALGAQLGADVPFTVLGGLAVGRGRGDRLESVPSEARLHLVFVPQNQGLSTPEVYRRWDQGHAVPARSGAHPASTTTPGPIDPQLLAAAAAGNAQLLSALIHNDLQAPALELLPELGSLLERGIGRGALTGWVSGSGPTVCFLAASADAASTLVSRLRDEHCLAFATTTPVEGAGVRAQ